MLSEQDSVSIVIPCYNVARYLRASIESALSQTYPYTEVIVVNDGSTDESPAILASYGDRIRVVHQENSGLAAARNAGILASKSPYILFLDADDVIEPSSVERLMRVMLSDEKIGFCYGDLITLDYKKGRIERLGTSEEAETKNLFYRFVRKPFVSADRLYRREVFRTCGFFDPLMRANEDLDHHIRLATRYKAGYDPEIQGYYRITPNSLSKNRVRSYCFVAKVLKKNSILAPNSFVYWCMAQQYLSWEAGTTAKYLMLKLPIYKGVVEGLILTWKHPLFPLHVLGAFVLKILGVFDRAFRR
jgi:glycosyltransferase involved in cell wall biosynthesis